VWVKVERLRIRKKKPLALSLTVLINGEEVLAEAAVLYFSM